MATSGDQPILEPLSFSTAVDGSSTLEMSSGISIMRKVLCPLCEKDFGLPEDFDSLNSHLQEQHSLLVSKIQEIADLPKYLNHWRQRVADGLKLHEICRSVLPEPDDQSSNGLPVYVLSEELEEDKELRSKLHLETLQERLDYQQKEREDDRFSRTCLFCTRHFHFNRSALFEHMTHYHHFNIGHPDNLVYTNELLEVLEEKLHKLQCLYCEKTFKDTFILKEHMRKKRHRRLRLSNYLYRQFFIVYPQSTKSAADLELSSGDDISDGDDDAATDDDQESAEHTDDHYDTMDSDESSSIDHNDWNDWVGNPEPEAVCLFCTQASSDTNVLFEHMKDKHRFDMYNLATSNKLTYYQQVKLVNYIRRQVHLKACISCAEKFEDRDALLNHLDSADHSSQLPDKTLWNQPQYFFPTYENDSLLCALVDNDEATGSADADEEVIAEDLSDDVGGPHQYDHFGFGHDYGHS